MAISRKQLNDGEFVVLSTRTHVKALLLPALLMICIAGVAGFLSTFPSGKAAPLLQAVIGAIALLVVLRVVVKPFLVWLTTTYTITNRRLVSRSGVLTRRGHDIPLIRVSDVSYERGLVDRLLGCGTLVVSDASEYGRVMLHDIPHVEQVHLKISEHLYDGADSSRTIPDHTRATYDGT
ncbi:MAG: PH domain-containing protein [Nocardioidaceae bacterium]